MPTLDPKTQIAETANKFDRNAPVDLPGRVKESFKALLELVADSSMPKPSEPKDASILQAIIGILDNPGAGVRVLAQDDESGSSLISRLSQAAQKAIDEVDTMRANAMYRIAQQSAILSKLLHTLQGPAFRGISTSTTVKENFDFASEVMKVGRDPNFGLGLLTFRDKDGKGVFDHLTELAAKTTSTDEGTRRVAPLHVRELIKELSNPLSTTQHRHGTCAAESIANVVFLQNPAEWCRYVVGLLGEGTAELYQPIPTPRRETLRLPYDFRSADFSDQRSEIAAHLQAAIKTSFANTGYEYSNQRDCYLLRDEEGSPIMRQNKKGEPVQATVPGGMEFKNEQRALEALLGTEYVRLDWSDCKLQEKDIERGVFCSLRWEQTGEKEKRKWENHAVLVMKVTPDEVIIRNPHRQLEARPGNLVGDPNEGPKRYAVDRQTGLERISYSEFFKRVNYVFVPREVIEGKKYTSTLNLPKTADEAINTAKQNNQGLNFQRYEPANANSLTTVSPTKPIVGVLKWTENGFNTIKILDYLEDEAKRDRTIRITGETLRLPDSVKLPRNVIVFENPNPTPTHKDGRSVQAGDIVDHDGPRRVVIDPTRKLEAMRLDMLPELSAELAGLKAAPQPKTNRRGFLSLAVKGGVAALAVGALPVVAEKQGWIQRAEKIVGPDGKAITGPLSLEQAHMVFNDRFIGPRQLDLLGLSVTSSPPDLPAALTGALLSEQCMIAENGQPVKDTHSLVFQPKGLTLRSLLSFLQKEHKVKVTFRHSPMSYDDVLDQPIDSDGWHLVCNSTPPDSQQDKEFKGVDLSNKLHRMKRFFPEYTPRSAISVVLGALPDLINGTSSTEMDPLVTSDVTLNPNIARDNLCVSISPQNREITIGREGDFGFSATGLAIERKLN